jgi:hypothetical protein
MDADSSGFAVYKIPHHKITKNVKERLSHPSGLRGEVHEQVMWLEISVSTPF